MVPICRTSGAVAPKFAGPDSPSTGVPFIETSNLPSTPPSKWRVRRTHSPVGRVVSLVMDVAPMPVPLRTLSLPVEVT